MTRSFGPTTSPASRAARAADHRPGRSSPAWPARPSASGWASWSRRSRSGIRGVREGRDDRGRDERRPDRGRRRGRLERARASAAGPRVPAHRSGPTSWRTRWRSCTACGGAGWLVVRRAEQDAGGGCCSGRAPSRWRVARRLRRRCPAADHRRRAGSPRSFRLAARSPTNSTSRRRPRHGLPVRALLDAACEALGREPATLALSAMTGVLVGRDDGAIADQARTRWQPSGRRRGRRVVARGTSNALGLRHAGRGAPSLCRGRRGADHAPGLPALGPRHGRRHGRGVRRAGIALRTDDACRAAVLRPAPAQGMPSGARRRDVSR